MREDIVYNSEDDEKEEDSWGRRVAKEIGKVVFQTITMTLANYLSKKTLQAIEKAEEKLSPHDEDEEPEASEEEAEVQEESEEDGE